MAMAQVEVVVIIALLTTLFTKTLSYVSIKNSLMYPLACSESIRTCNSSLYHIYQGFTPEEIASFYAVDVSQMTPIYHDERKDYLISVPCGCTNVTGTIGYFYDTSYNVRQNDTFDNVTTTIYSEQAWNGGERFDAGTTFPIHLLCGCPKTDSQVVVTYTVQTSDTLSKIGDLLSAHLVEIESLNRKLTENPGYIDVGWVLYVPMEKNGIKNPKQGTRHVHVWLIIISILSSVTLLSTGTVIIFLIRRKKALQQSEEDPKAVSRSLGSTRTNSLQSHYNNEDMTAFETERPAVYDIDDIEEATSNFSETRKIGEGGYGCVYFGELGEQEVAVKKMKSNKSKEFFAELKVLCRIHHKNVVELLGYASGDDHLYLVYEYLQNGSLSEHLHDPLVKGHPPLSWTARAQIALDTARGIEYIHDHTKAQYVHRDIKTTNILLDEGLRAKVADFGLAKLVERSNEEELMATRLVGTPGYLPPESVRELQMTSKSDVFAFGVVLAELITGKRALVRDNQEPNSMKSLISVVHKIFQEEDPEIALEAMIDGNLRGDYPPEDVYKMAEISEKCLSEEAVDRPEMQEIVVSLSQIVISSIEWEASLGGTSQVFSGVFNGR